MKTTFNTHTLSESIEQKALSDLSAQELFSEWCQINSSILPQFLTRKEWEKLHKKQILQEEEEKLLLFLPQDIQLWEMIEIIKKIDHNTFKSKPEKQIEKANHFSELGRKFEKAGLYLANYFPLENHSEDAKLAQNLAQQFYSYGCSLQQKTKKSDTLPQKISLSEDELSKIDQRLLGKEAYAKRLARLGALPSKESLDTMRKELLTVAFKALTKQGSKEQGEMPRELNKDHIYKLQEKVQEQLLRAIQTPETELYNAIFRRGKEKLLNEMPAQKLQEQIGLIDNLKSDIPKLIDIVQIDQLKAELDIVRKTGDIKLRSKKELAIAKKIQKIISSLPYEENSNIPIRMLQTGQINCVGASILGSLLLEELNIKHLSCNLPGHSSTILITSDGKRYRQDFTPGTCNWKENYKEITSDMLEDEKDLSNIKKQEKGILKFKIWAPYNFIKKPLRVYVSNPIHNLGNSILLNSGVYYDINNKPNNSILFYKQIIANDPNNIMAYKGLGNGLFNLGKYEEALQCYQQAITLDPDDSSCYNSIGNTLINLKKYNESLFAFKKSISIDPSNIMAYNGLGNGYFYLEDYEQAINSYNQAININPNYASPYNGLGDSFSQLGKHKKAIKFYKTFIQLWKGNPYRINRANKEITRLKKEIKNSQK